MLRRTVSLVAVVVFAARLHAQGPTVASASVSASACTYATCAIRLENGGFSGPRIRTGLDGVARKVGFSGGGIVGAVRDVPAALTEAQLGQSRLRRGRITGLIATSAAFAWVMIAAQSKSDATRLNSIYGGTSLGIIGGIVSAIDVAKADQHFSRAVWQFNGTLPR